MDKYHIFVILLILISILGTEGKRKKGHRKKARQCEPITMEMCEDVGYNMTSYPNILNHQTQVRHLQYLFVKFTLFTILDQVPSKFDQWSTH